jgi:hypothetical protein
LGRAEIAIQTIETGIGTHGDEKKNMSTISTQTEVSLPQHVECLWQPHVSAKTVVDVSQAHLDGERARGGIVSMEREQPADDLRQANVSDADGMASADGTGTEPDRERSHEDIVEFGAAPFSHRLGDNEGPGRSHLPLTSQAEAKPCVHKLPVVPTEPVAPIAAEDQIAETENEELETSLRSWHAERKAQRADHSGISDEMFDFDDLEAEIEAEEVQRQSPAKHQPGAKRNRKDELWWQARKGIEIDSIDIDDAGVQDVGEPGLVDSDDEEDVPDCPNTLLDGAQLRRREVRLAKEEVERLRMITIEKNNRARDAEMPDLTNGRFLEAEPRDSSIADSRQIDGFKDPSEYAYREEKLVEYGIDDSRPIDAVGNGDRPASQRKPIAATMVGGRRLRLARGITVDSGAADNVMPRRMLRKGRNKIRPSPASRAGVHYVVANDGRIPNEGEADFEFQTKDGESLSWLFQIAEVNKTLAAVSALVDTGHRVVFDRDEETGLDTSFITHKASGKSIKMRRERNVWVIDAYLEEDELSSTEPLFSGHR